MAEIVPFLKDLLSKKHFSSSSRVIIRDNHYTPVSGNPVLIRDSGFRDTIFVDGGQGVLFDSALFCVAKIRIVACYFDSHGANVWSRSVTCSLVTYVDTEKTISIKCQVLQDDLSSSFETLDLSFDVTDPSLVAKGKELTPNAVVNIVRRHMELSIVQALGQDYPDFFICLDGSLRPQSTAEIRFLEQMPHNVCALAKTNGFVAESRSLKLLDGLSFLCIATPLDAVYPTLYFVHLHDLSKYVFVFECLESVEELLSALSAHCADPRFLGYPYGLVKVDRLARVSNLEVEQDRARLRILLQDVWGDIEPHLRTKDAHGVLDRISW